MGLIFKKSTAQPAFTVAAAITGTTEATQTLTCAYTVVRARAVNVTVRWYRHTADDGTDPAGTLLGTGDTYVLTGTDVGNYIRAIVTAINPAGTVQSTTSYTAIITSGDPPTPPALVTPAAITGTADIGETLTVTYSFTGQTSVAIQWYSYASEPTGNPLVGTDEVLLGTASTQALTETEAGRWIGVVVTATNAVDDTQTSASVAMAGVDPYAPIAPAQYTVPAYDDSALEKIYAYAGDDLQAKLNQLAPGKCLVLEAGATWTGEFTIPSTVDGGDWAYIISSALESLPAEGTRVSTSDATLMPTIKSGVFYTSPRAITSFTVDGLTATIIFASTGTVPLAGGTVRIAGAIEPEWNSDFTVISNSSIRITFAIPEGMTEPTGSLTWSMMQPRVPALEIGYGRSKLRIAGVEISTDYNAYNGLQYGLVRAYASDIVFDRCYVHGPPTGDNRDGFILYDGCANFAIIDSIIDDLKGRGESHAIHIFQAEGPVLVRNNTIRSCGINVFINDNLSPSTPDGTRPVNPADITISRNLIEKKASWLKDDPTWDGFDHTQKGLIESKGSRRVLIEGNVFHRGPYADQPGQPFFAQNIGGDGVSDIDFRNNLIVDCGQFGLANPFDGGRGYGWERVRWENNLYYKMRPNVASIAIGNAGTGIGRYLTVNKNTWVVENREPASCFAFSAPTNTALTPPVTPSGLVGVKVTNNIMVRGKNGITSNGNIRAEVAVAYHITDYLFSNNLVVRNPFTAATAQNNHFIDGSAYYTNWYNEASSGLVGYVNTAFAAVTDFAITPESAYYTAATDGGPVGCNVSAVIAAINTSDVPTLG